MSVSLVVINSWGPMGSSLLASLVEKWGYLNIPIRQTGLTEYLMGRRPLTDPAIRKNFRQSFERASKPGRHLGLSVSDRDSAVSKVLIDFARIEDKLAQLEVSHFDRIEDLYNAYRALYSEAVCYKRIDSRPGQHIELVVDGWRAFGDKGIEEVYAEHFDDVKFFHMTRNFDEWAESLASQYMANANRRYQFRLGQAAEEYEKYNESIDRLSGIKVDIDDLMIPNFSKAVALLSDILGPIKKSSKLEQEVFDVWGGLAKFEYTFSKRDSVGKYLSNPSRVAMRTLREHVQSRFGQSLGFHPFFVFESAKHAIFG
jgi:hypothetical protein